MIKRPTMAIIVVKRIIMMKRKAMTMLVVKRIKMVTMAAQESLGVSRISLSVTTMDDVFLKIGEMVEAKVNIPQFWPIFSAVRLH